MKNLLEKASSAYYEGNPFMSDEVFDSLAKKYNYNKVGHIPKDSNKIKHKYRLYSLQNVFKGEDKVPFEDSDVVITPKLDGAAIALEYKEGFLVAAATRGDGIYGQNIYEKALYLVPIKINNKNHIQISGEVVAPNTIKNSRNYASGALNLKDIEEFKERDVTFITYDIKGIEFRTYNESLTWLALNDFDTVDKKNLDKIYPTDGLVYRINNNERYKKLAYTAHHPRGAYALKDKKDVEIKETILRNIIWQNGAGGKITPVALFDTVEIGGAKVGRATLHNAGFVEGLELELGDTLLITRSGGVIPKVIGKV